tara:strand:- start:171 stop:458 length:288 start_codon:yes stop_codon:yes gene_type:complete
MSTKYTPPSEFPSDLSTEEVEKIIERTSVKLQSHEYFKTFRRVLREIDRNGFTGELVVNKKTGNISISTNMYYDADRDVYVEMTKGLWKDFWGDK